MAHLTQQHCCVEQPSSRQENNRHDETFGKFPAVVGIVGTLRLFDIVECLVFWWRRHGASHFDDASWHYLRVVLVVVVYWCKCSQPTFYVSSCDQGLSVASKL